MITHFQYKPLYKDQKLPGWSISFYLKNQLYKAVYHRDGNIEYTGAEPDVNDLAELSSMIHELMLYHVYE
jgi:Family of unknown function (DUF5342)